MLGIEIRKRNETRQRSCPWEAYSLSGMMNIGMTRINDNARWHVQTINSMGTQKSRFPARAGEIREKPRDGVGV